ncbi:sugar phosphate nucleotidyltransferase [Alicyclobacillus sendaiensis]|uniref:sugar phosphate nucleotidyltransferase n=1 Tax=Alicyclobacillus sendaiensis TaxID=192387 RepID=UPI000785EA17|nr:sugar phosphate nucleotidyltransferase [Alicyclobacillus sendaiensis]
MDIGCAVIPAAGLGTRLRPATLWIPKEMFPVLNTPAIAYALEEALAAGVERLVVVIHPRKALLRDFLEAWARERGPGERRVRVQWVVQEEPLGLGDAVRRAKEAVLGEAFYVLLPDELFLAETPPLLQLTRGAPATWAAIVGTQKVPLAEVHQYGMVGIGQGGRVTEMVEKPAASEAPSNVAMMGRYALTSRIFDALADVKPGAKGEIQLTDALRLLLPDGVYARHVAGERFDIGNAAGWARAAQALARIRRLEAPADFTRA